MLDRDAGVVNDCWNRIGVQGDRSCPRLKTYVHCRQCPVYSAAAKALLYRVAPSDDAVAGTAPGSAASAGAVSKATAAADATSKAGASAGAVSNATASAGAAPAVAAADNAVSLLIFRLRAEWLALPVAALAEVTPMRPIHSLPRRSGIMLGVCNVRGRLIPCISLAALLDLAPQPDEEDAKAAPRMLVVSTHTGTIVVPVDDVAGIQSYPASAVGPLPDTLAGARYASGVVRHGERTVGLLDNTRIALAIEERLA